MNENVSWRIRTALQGALLIVAWCASMPSVAAEDGLRVGAAKREITPTEPVPMWGYGARHDKLSTGVIDALHAAAVVIQVGSRKLAVVGLDLGRSPSESSLQRIREVIKTEQGIAKEASVGEGTMVDTWATVGSCAQIGKNVHLSGGVGIGGVLEPLQASPTIIEDHCFIGARSEVVEGVVVGHHSVIGMGVFLSQSTRIYDRATGQISYGRVPPGSVVVPGSLPSADGRYSLACAVIVKRVDAQTRAKTSLNDLLRD